MGGLHYVIFPAGTTCFRFNCDICGTASGRREDVWFSKKVPIGLKEAIKEGKIAFAYTKTCMWTIYLEDDQLFIREDGKPLGIDFSELEPMWKIERLLWIGHIKGRQDDCWFSKIPSDALKLIIEQLRPKWRARTKESSIKETL